MKKTIILIVLMSFLVIAAPPTLENHQFYGTVAWDAGADYKTVTATIDGTEFTSVITDIVCTNVCTGKYGYGEDNLLYIQGSGAIDFSLDSLKVTTATYQAFATSELPLDISTLPIETCEVKWDCTDFSVCTGSKQTRTCTRADTCGDVTAQIPAEEKSCLVLTNAPTVLEKIDEINPTAATTTTPTTTTPTTTTKQSTTTQEEVMLKKESSNLMLWVGGGLLLLLVIIGLFFMLKKKPGQDIPLE